jgi:hypothetical protein
MAMGVLDASGLDCVDSAGAITETGTVHVDVLPVSIDQEDPVIRVAIRHLDAPPSDTSTLASCFARVALLMVAKHCDGTTCASDLSSAVSAAIAASSRTFSKDTGDWDVSVQVPSGPRLHVSRGTAMASDVKALEVDGITPTFVPLAVNGRAIPLLP